MPLPSPRFASVLSTHAGSDAALGEALAGVTRGMAGEVPDLVVAFATPHHRSALETLGPRLAEATGCEVVLGCTGESIIGPDRAVESQPALSVWAARLPETRVRFFTVSAGMEGEDRVGFTRLPPVAPNDEASLLLLADPFSFPMDLYLRALNDRLSGIPAIGGMASGGQAPGEHRLITAEGVLTDGAIGVALEGAIEVRAVVSQGCRPVGRPFVITQGSEQRIEKIGGKLALTVLARTLRELPEDERALFQRGPFLGLAIDPTKSEFGRDDFLVRAVLGTDTTSGALVVADRVRRGQTIQFLVRDAASASEDLDNLMASVAPGGGGADPAGALLFSCNGRGSHLFSSASHDVERVRAGLSDDAALAGFFANGEIGPVGGNNFLHGFTASVAVFRTRG